MVVLVYQRVYANMTGVYRWDGKWDPCYHIYQHHGSVMGLDMNGFSIGFSIDTIDTSSWYR